MFSKIRSNFQTNEEESIDTDDIIAFCLTLFVLATLCFGTWVIYKTTYIFNQECLNPLELVQNATTIEIAQKYLNLTLPKCQNFAIKNNWNFWYDNLKAQQEILNSINPEDSELKKQQILNLVLSNLKKESDWRN